MPDIKSRNIKVYPTAWRGKTGNDIFNPESRLFTEENATRPLIKLADYDKGTFLITTDKDSQLLEFVINGYFFEIKNTSLNDIAEDFSGDNIYAFITWGENADDVNNVKFRARTLKAAEDGASTNLDDEINGNFIGVAFTDDLSDLPSQNNSKALCLLEKQEGVYQIPAASLLKYTPETIKGGEDGGEVKPLTEYLDTAKITTETLYANTSAEIKDVTVTGKLDVNQIKEYTHLIPERSNSSDLGSSSKKFKEANIIDIKSSTIKATTSIETPLIIRSNDHSFVIPDKTGEQIGVVTNFTEEDPPRQYGPIRQYFTLEYTRPSGSAALTTAPWNFTYEPMSSALYGVEYYNNVQINGVVSNDSNPNIFRFKCFIGGLTVNNYLPEQGDTVWFKIKASMLSPILHAVSTNDIKFLGANVSLSYVNTEDMYNSYNRFVVSGTVQSGKNANFDPNLYIGLCNLSLPTSSMPNTLYISVDAWGEY